MISYLVQIQLSFCPATAHFIATIKMWLLLQMPTLLNLLTNGVLDTPEMQ